MAQAALLCLAQVQIGNLIALLSRLMSSWSTGSLWDPKSPNPQAPGPAAGTSQNLPTPGGKRGGDQRGERERDAGKMETPGNLREGYECTGGSSPGSRERGCEEMGRVGPVGGREKEIQRLARTGSGTSRPRQPGCTRKLRVSHLPSEPTCTEDALCVCGTWQRCFIYCSQNTARLHPRHSQKRKPAPWPGCSVGRASAVLPAKTPTGP